MKIGILGTRGIPNHYGGFEQFAEQLSAELVARGHDIYVYNSSLHPYQEKKWQGVHIIHCRDMENKLGTAGQFIYDLNCINDARKRDFDVLLHLGYTSDSVWHWRWPEKRTVNIVNMDGMEWQRSKYNRPTRLFLKWAEALAVKNARVLVADSEVMQLYLQNKYDKKPVFIPYCAEVFNNGDPSVPGRHQLNPHEYFLLLSRMEPENNIEMIIRGYLQSTQPFPLFIIGNITNKYGRYITGKYRHPSLFFSDAIYDQAELDNLRYYSSLYFHGHSAGGTNPSLLEAMACHCRIAAHDNRFNRAVLQQEAFYFNTADEVSTVIGSPQNDLLTYQWKKINTARISTIYNKEKIVDAYEKMMLEACGIKKPVVKPSVALAR